MTNLFSQSWELRDIGNDALSSAIPVALKLHYDGTYFSPTFDFVQKLFMDHIRDLLNNGFKNNHLSFDGAVNYFQSLYENEYFDEVDCNFHKSTVIKMQSNFFKTIQQNN